MKNNVYYTIFCVVFVTTMIFLFSINKQKHNPKLNIITDPIPVQYVGKVSAKSVNIRLLVLKHCLESMADGDANLAIEAANLAQSKGLNIQDIGNYYIDREGQRHKLVFDVKLYKDGLKDFISQQMKVNAQKGDTLVIFTIGHGAAQGYLQDLGQRKEIFDLIAEAAEENDQETLWWQLSCYASAALPSISTLNDKQQDLFSIVASSDANTQSPAYTEGHIMEDLFLKLIDDQHNVDNNDDQIVNAQELSDALNEIERGRGDLVYARSPNEAIFGLGLARLLPIIDRNNKQHEYPKDYIQYPKDKQPIPNY